ncbi:MAG: hypothetical protein Q8L77_06335 [Nitrospirota bacterium]|nr:hypothetical protein [Nitrospirota bacterium]
MATHNQQQVAAQVNSLLELLEHAPEAEVEQWLLENVVMQEMDRLCQLLGMPSVGCDGQAAFAKEEEEQ